MDSGGIQINQHGAAPIRYYLTDERNSVTGMISPSGTTTATLEYDPYGNTTTTTGDPGNSPWRYISGYYDTEGDGYYHLNARYYDPSTGRFTQPDSIKGSISRADTFNPYLYGNCDPINDGDPSGLLSATCIVTLVALAAAIGATAQVGFGAPAGPLAIITVALGLASASAAAYLVCFGSG